MQQLNFFHLCNIQQPDHQAQRFRLPLPPSVNRMYKTTKRGGMYKSREAKDWIERVRWQCRSQGIELLVNPVVLDVTWYFPTRSGDVDNRAKALLDALEGVLYDNDRLVCDLYLHRRKDTNDPRVEVVAWEYVEVAEMEVA